MKGIFSVLVENKDGVLSQISGLFARRGFNIDSLAVGVTERKDISSYNPIFLQKTSFAPLCLLHLQKPQSYIFPRICVVLPT